MKSVILIFCNISYFILFFDYLVFLFFLNLRISYHFLLPKETTKVIEFIKWEWDGMIEWLSIYLLACDAVFSLVVI